MHYFDMVKDGGIYIVEDLHCSYWGDWEGGLYDPYSSLAFFKRLVDAINYEHWGIDRLKIEPLLGILRKYNIEFNSRMLEYIHSVKFVNSMCFIRKQATGMNELGARIVAGTNHPVESAVANLNGTFSHAPSQMENPWSTFAAPPDEITTELQKTVENLNNNVVTHENTICSLQQQIEASNQQAQSLQSDIANQQQENAALTVDLTQTRTQLAQVQEVILGLRQQLAAADQQEQALQSDLAHQQQENAALTVDLTQTQAQLTQTRGQLDHTQHQLLRTHNRVDLVQDRHKHTQNMLEQAQSQLEQTQYQLSQTQQQSLQTQDQLEQTQSQLAQTQSHLGQTQGQLGHARELLEQTQSQLMLAQNQIETLIRSTSWRATALLRRIGVHVPPAARRPLRRALKAAWWAVTPWRMPARLEFLRARKAAAQRSASVQPIPVVQSLVMVAPAPAVMAQPVAAAPASAAGDPVIIFVPPENPSSTTNTGHYALVCGTRHYTYIPPRPPENLEQELTVMETHPLFSIVVPVYNTPPNLLDKLVGSVLTQWYPYWELILVNDNSPLAHVRADLDKLTDPRIVIKHLDKNQGISGATNEGLSCATGDYIVFADHDDELTADCLYELTRCVEHENPDYIYSDEDKIAEDGQFVQPHFKPDWSPDTLMSTMYTCHVSCVRRELINEIGGLRPEYDGSQDWDFILRVTEKAKRIVHVPKVLYHWRIIPASLAADIMAKPYAVDAGKRAREDALLRRGLDGWIEPATELPGYFRTVYRPRGEPEVSIIIPSKNNHHILKQCINSIELKTTYQNFNILIIDNNSNEPATIQYINRLHTKKGVRVLSYDRLFNFSAINNFGVAQTDSELLLFLNDDTEVLTPDWLDRLIGYAQLPHVGAVGAKLLYPDRKHVQHAGVVNLVNGPSHAFLQAGTNDPCYFARAVLECDWLAVTGACLMVERTKFDSVGQFDESLPVAYNDVDLCFRLVEHGFYNVVSPGVKLIHYESYSRGMDHADPAKLVRLRKDRESLYSKHSQFYAHDPFHNPNFSPNDLWFRESL
jgi:GT2 family glycosyltransferase